MMSVLRKLPFPFWYEIRESARKMGHSHTWLKNIVYTGIYRVFTSKVIWVNIMQVLLTFVDNWFAVPRSHVRIVSGAPFTFQDYFPTQYILNIVKTSNTLCKANVSSKTDFLSNYKYVICTTNIDLPTKSYFIMY